MPLPCPFAKVSGFSVEPPRRGKGEVRVRVNFLMEGEKDAERRVRAELWAMNAEGRTLWHTWELQGDARRNKPMHVGSLIATPSIVNHQSLGDRLLSAARRMSARVRPS